jgi:predicted acetyltransferase
VIDAVRLTPARSVDVPILAAMNKDLIAAEGGPDLGFSALAQRMASFLECGYQAYLIATGEDMVGYALFRRDVDHVWLRQFYVASRRRRSGVGRSAFEWLRANVWGETRVILQVRTGNDPAMRFWRALDFEQTATTLEWSAARLGTAVR